MKLNLESFGILSYGEKLLVEKCQAGKVIDLEYSYDRVPTDNNFIRADFLRFIIADAEGSTFIHDRGLEVRNAIINGDLDLLGATASKSIAMRGCFF